MTLLNNYEIVHYIFNLRCKFLPWIEFFATDSVSWLCVWKRDSLCVCVHAHSMFRCVCGLCAYVWDGTAEFVCVCVCVCVYVQVHDNWLHVCGVENFPNYANLISCFPAHLVIV
jgi:hypothetical protein